MNKLCVLCAHKCKPPFAPPWMFPALQREDKQEEVNWPAQRCTLKSDGIWAQTQVCVLLMFRFFSLFYTFNWCLLTTDCISDPRGTNMNCRAGNAGQGHSIMHSSARWMFVEWILNQGAQSPQERWTQKIRATDWWRAVMDVRSSAAGESWVSFECIREVCPSEIVSVKHKKGKWALGRGSKCKKPRGVKQHYMFWKLHYFWLP